MAGNQSDIVVHQAPGGAVSMDGTGVCQPVPNVLGEFKKQPSASSI